MWDSESRELSIAEPIENVTAFVLGARRGPKLRLGDFDGGDEDDTPESLQDRGAAEYSPTGDKEEVPFDRDAYFIKEILRLRKEGKNSGEIAKQLMVPLATINRYWAETEPSTPSLAKKGSAQRSPKRWWPR